MLRRRTRGQQFDAQVPFRGAVEIRARLAFSSKLEGYWIRQMQPWLIRWFAPELGEEPRTGASCNAFSQALAGPCR
jgi:hypothetical protein